MGQEENDHVFQEKIPYMRGGYWLVRCGEGFENNENENEND